MADTATIDAPVASAKEQFDRQAAQYNGRWANWSDETLQSMLALAGHLVDIREIAK